VKTVTVEISEELAQNLQTLAALFGWNEPIGEILEKRAGWVISNLVEDQDSGELCDLLAGHWWDTREEAQAIAERVNVHFRSLGGTYFTEAGRCAEGWEIQTFAGGRHIYWYHLWKHCQATGADFEAVCDLARKYDNCAEGVAAIIAAVKAGAAGEEVAA